MGIGFGKEIQKKNMTWEDIIETELPLSEIALKSFKHKIHSASPYIFGIDNQYALKKEITLSKLHDFLIEKGFSCFWVAEASHTPEKLRHTLDKEGAFTLTMSENGYSGEYWKLEEKVWTTAFFSKKEFKVSSNNKKRASEIAHELLAFYDEAEIDLGQPEIGLVNETNRGLDILDFDLPKLDVNTFQLNYNKETHLFLEQMASNLREEFKGIYLLWGEPGTGKSTAIQYLSARVPERKFIFIPSGCDAMLANPDLITLLSNNTESVLVLEDAELALAQRSGDLDRTAIANILNISDGIMGAALKLSIIATFNCEISKIDPALLRSGRCKGNHKFEKLSRESIENLCKYFNIEVSLILKEGEDSLALCDFYERKHAVQDSIEPIVNKSEGKENKKPSEKEIKEVLNTIKNITKKALKKKTPKFSIEFEPWNEEDEDEDEEDEEEYEE